MILRKYHISDTLRLYATLSALQLLCFNKNPDDGSGWNSEFNRTQLFQESENVFVDLFPEQSIFNQDDMNLRKILEESTFQSWQSHLARKSLVEDLIRFDRNDNDRKITLYPLDIKNETQEASNSSSVSLSSMNYDIRPFSFFQLPNDTRNFDSLASYGLDETKPSSFNDFPTQDVFLDNSFYDLHLNTIANASNSLSLPSSSNSANSASSSSHGKSKKNPLKKDAVLPNINRIRRQDIDFFNRFTSEEWNEEAAGPAMREQESLAIMSNSLYKQDVDLGYTLSNYHQSYSMPSLPRQVGEAEKVEVIQNINHSKITESNEQIIDIGYLLSLSSNSPNVTNNESLNVTSHQKLLNIEEDSKLAEILYEQDMDLGYILSPSPSKQPFPPKVVDQTSKKKVGEENSNDGDLWAGIPFKIDNETGEYIRLPFEDLLKSFIDDDNSKDETGNSQEEQTTLDIDAAMEDIANLLTPNSDFLNVEIKNSQYVQNDSFSSTDNPNLSYETQPNQSYDYNNQRVQNFYRGNLDPVSSLNNLCAAGDGSEEVDTALDVHNDAYLDSILNSECFKMMTASSSEGSGTKHQGNQSNDSASHGNKGSDKPSRSSDAVPGGITNFMDLSCGSTGSTLGSLGSESLPSTSDGEWGEGSESGHDYQRSNFYGPFDYSVTNGNFTARKMPVAQKKYHMFGKRYLQEEMSNNTLENSKINTLHAETAIKDLEGKENSTFDDFKDEIKTNPSLNNINKNMKKTVKAERDKFKSTMDENLVQHNHTYALSHSHVSNPALEQDGSEYGDGPSEEGHLTRDEKRARNLNIPIPVIDIINLPMDEFNECISKYDLNENQLSLIRDIRRRGKNKVAAQNCRKRKLDTILSLESEVEEVRRRKEKLHNEKAYVAMEKRRIASKFAALHKHIFHYLKDDDGKPCSSSKFSLQQAADGSMYLLPRENSKQDPNCYMSLLLGEQSSSSGTCRDRSRVKEAFSRTSSDETHSITEL